MARDRWNAGAIPIFPTYPLSCTILNACQNFIARTTVTATNDDRSYGVICILIARSIHKTMP